MTILDEAAHLVGSYRQDAYGHPFDNWGRTAAHWSVILRHEVTAEEAALCMIAAKLDRHAYRPKDDHLVDIAGYALVVKMIQDERARRAAIAEPAVPPAIPTLPEHDE